jgi:type III secretion system low calcium response chaperone LcrH/SycD
MQDTQKNKNFSPNFMPEKTDANEELTAESIIEHLNNGATLADVIGITLEQREAIYTMGHYQYTQGKYIDAMKFFRFLLFHDQFDLRAIFGVGCCLQMQGDYSNAQIFLGMVVMMEPTNPTSGVQFAECLLMDKKKNEAIDILQKTRMEFGKIPQHQLLIRRVDALLNFAITSNAEDSKHGSK